MRPKRLGSIFFALGLALLLATMARAGETLGYTIRLDLEPDEHSLALWPSLWSPVELEIYLTSTNGSVTISILDEHGLRLWEQVQEVRPVASFEGEKLAASFNIPRRERYSLLAHGASYETEVELTLVFRGLEKDLLIFSVALIVLGIGSAAMGWLNVTSMLRPLFVRWRCKKPPEEESLRLRPQDDREDHLK